MGAVAKRFGGRLTAPAKEKLPILRQGDGISFMIGEKDFTDYLVRAVLPAFDGYVGHLEFPKVGLNHVRLVQYGSKKHPYGWPYGQIPRKSISK